MIQYNYYKDPHTFSAVEEGELLEFLYKHLEDYGDDRDDIQKCLDYALQRNHKPGGMIISARYQDELVGAVVINYTGMQGYIPENILVYIAAHGSYRGRGIGKRLMEIAVEQTEGSIALHVEPDNPAKKLYEKVGFTNKYLEMRLTK